MKIKSNYTFNCYISTLKSPCFALVWFSVIVVSYFYFDKPIAFFFRQLKHSDLYNIANYVSDFGKGIYYIIGFTLLFLIAKFILHKQYWSRVFAFLFCAVVIPGIITRILKLILSRSRPTMLFHYDIYGFYFLKTKNAFHSFPSGHATTIAGLTIALALLWSRWWYLFITAAVLISLTRIIVTAHFLSDIMMGFYIGSIITLWLYEQFWFNTPTLSRGA